MLSRNLRTLCRKLKSRMGARNQVVTLAGLSYRPAGLCSLATRFLESIPHPISGLKFSTLSAFVAKALQISGHGAIRSFLAIDISDTLIFAQNIHFE